MVLWSVFPVRPSRGANGKKRGSAGQFLGPVVLFVEHEYAAAVFPLREYQTSGCFPIELNLMFSRAMGVSVDQKVRLMIAYNHFNRFLIDVHDFLGFLSFVQETANPVPSGIGQPE